MRDHKVAHTKGVDPILIEKSQRLRCVLAQLKRRKLLVLCIYIGITMDSAYTSIVAWKI